MKKLHRHLMKQEEAFSGFWRVINVGKRMAVNEWIEGRNRWTEVGRWAAAHEDLVGSLT